MQVSCESCGARYELDDSRFSGRGARITCPRCQHVFVVYREETDEEASSEAETATATEQKTYHVDELDFRKVGIQAWKVKVKIGLVYDFSDYKTLAKYITDGRVTTADKISHDGKDWIEIGSIPDLAQHFIDVYVKAEQEQSGGGSSPSVSGVAEFDGDEPTDIFGLQQAEAEEAAKKAASASRAEPKKAAPRAPSPPKSGRMGVDDDLMKMAQNISADMASGNAKGSGPSRFVDPFEQMRRKKRRPVAETSTEPSSSASGSDSSEAKPGRSKLLLVGLFGVAALALGYVYIEMGSTPPPADAGKNQGQAQAKQEQTKADQENADDSTSSMVTEPTPVSSLDSFSGVSADAFLDGTGRAYMADEVEQRDTIHFMKVPLTEEECPSNWYAKENGKPVQKADASCTAQGGSVEPQGPITESESSSSSQAPPQERGPTLTDIEAMILVKAPLSGNEDAAECNTRTSNDAWRTLDSMNDSPDVNFLKGLYQTICKYDDDAANRYYSQVAGKAKVRAWNTWASDYLSE